MRRNNFRNASTVAALAAVLGVFGRISSGAAQNWVSDTDASKPNSAVSALGEVDWDHWDNIKDLLTQIHSKTGIPAIAAACVMDGKIVDQATVGMREFGKSSPAAEKDPFHLGSVTKSMTATLIGKLVEQNVLSWQTRIGDVLTKVEMRSEYRDVTVEDLLHHRAGLPSFTSGAPKGARPASDYRGSPTEIRAAFVADLLKFKPTGRPGRSFLYSNAGYAVVGYMAERATGESWERLIKKHVFRPLGMKTGGFGFPEYPAGHHGHGPKFRQTLPEQYPPMDHIAPAGNVHCSVGDLARYAMFHLDGLKGKDGYLRSETVRRLHTPPVHEDGSRYAAGWFVRDVPGGDEVHYHGGTVSSSYAEIKLLPKSGLGVVVLLNVGSNVAESVANKIGRSIIARFRKPGTSTMAKAGSGREKARIEMTIPGSSSSWKSAGDGAGESNRIEIEQLDTASAEDDARFWKVIKRMAHSFNDEDLDAYLSMFSSTRGAKVRDRQSMFEFMAKGVMPRRGSVRSFHALSKPVRIPDSPYPVRIAIFHFENGYPGYLGLSLDSKGKIDHFSLFVKSDLCPNGADPLCKRIVTTISDKDAP